ncbi:uncharacterized protein LOC106179825 [Lingula anatina]|uniref:Uncharacterized protein LOC106179825 n=1 Tax=Lingula anatina TaxID=7574 RepID=A0A1S3K988_LINAN|nr:uncharacterized protein LOC106179825 [Lingula anatina]XP_013419063.1 uncharacterized protein LOC106179825 [Lingula anatina]|eukprot:XP_013419062.1 uncharacterized protein LOC106179825 [Lingula anatina]
MATSSLRKARQLWSVVQTVTSRSTCISRSGALSQLQRLANIQQTTGQVRTAAKRAGKTANLEPDEPAMYCNQCEQTKNRTACTAIGVCGKVPKVAHMQDLLIHVMRGVSIYGHRAAQMGVVIDERVYDFMFGTLFSTLTNVNFDPMRFRSYILEAVGVREELKQQYLEACQKKGVAPEEFSSGPAAWFPPDGSTDEDTLDEEGKKFTLTNDVPIYGADIAGVRQMIVFGLKGMSTYARHAHVLGQDMKDIGAFVMEVFDFLENGPVEERNDLAAMLGWALKVGEANVKVMERLDIGHREQFGAPSPAQVSTKPKPGKAILVSGHDMHDLLKILEATEGTGINVYTHGEMLPAHSYPWLRKFKHLAGHFGGAWQLQQFEFPTFPGPVVITTNCMIEPMKSYKNRLFTLNDCGWPGVEHIDIARDMDRVIKLADELKGFPEADDKTEEQFLSVGFGRDVLLDNADKVIEAVKSGELKRIFVVGGCDGAEHKRNYFATLVDSLPPETVVLTMGCAKFRFNRKELGTLGTTGLPRLLDMGQCNDSYGAVVVANALAGAFETDINSLPLSIALSWFEQKAVAVLLSLLHLGVKNIRLGPVLPAFITPTVLDILVDKYQISAVDVRHPKEDLKLMMGSSQ